jgi:hypothetical protein
MNNINDNLVTPISDDLIKALRNLENVVSNARKGTCLMDANKRSQARKKRKKNKKK